MEVRRYIIGQLEFDYEPCGLPCMWDLSGFFRTHRSGEYTYTCGLETVDSTFKEEKGVEITQPLNQLVDLYDKLIYPGYWSGCPD